MGVLFVVGDDTNELLVPFVQERNPAISREQVNACYLRASLGEIDPGQFWREVGLGDVYPKVEETYLDSHSLAARMTMPTFQMPRLNESSCWLPQANGSANQQVQATPDLRRSLSDMDNQTTTDDVTIDGRQFVVTWLPPPFVPPRELTTQCGGICFTDQGQIVVVTSNGETWGLPAGHPEPGETLEEAFVREVAEEACARVLAFAYIGCQKVVGRSFDADWKEPLHFSARFWARVELLPFAPKHETTERRMVPPAELLAVLKWHTTRCAQAMLLAAQTEEGKRTRSRRRRGRPRALAR